MRSVQTCVVFLLCYPPTQGEHRAHHPDHPVRCNPIGHRSLHPSGRALIMTVIAIFDVRYICRILPEGGFILNAYTPISFD